MWRNSGLDIGAAAGIGPLWPISSARNTENDKVLQECHVKIGLLRHYEAGYFPHFVRLDMGVLPVDRWTEWTWWAIIKLQPDGQLEQSFFNLYFVERNLSDRLRCG